MNFAVIDLETTFSNTVMTAGVLISNDEDYKIQNMRYYLVRPREPGWYSSEIWHPRLNSLSGLERVHASAEYFEKDLVDFLRLRGVQHLFAYNAGFDRSKLPLIGRQGFIWVDIISKAAYRSTNSKLPNGLDYHSTGRLKRNYGVEYMYTYMTGRNYQEIHNAILDCVDELEIMKQLGYPVKTWAPMGITRGR